MDWLLLAWPAAVAVVIIGGGVALQRAAEGPRYRGVHERPPYPARHVATGLDELTVKINWKGRARVEDQQRE